MKEEQDILKKVGTKNPFRVPEGYFESFTQELMSKLPEKEAYIPEPEANLWTRVKPWLYMTAMFMGIMLSVRIFVGEPQKEDFPISVSEAESVRFVDVCTLFFYNEVLFYSSQEFSRC